MLKRIARRILSSRCAAPLLRLALRPLADYLPDNALRLVHIGPVVTARLPHGRTMRYCGGEDLLAKALFWRGCGYPETETMDLFLSLVGFSTVMLDIGASSGLFSIAGACSNPSLLVHAFEPVPRIFDLLQRNIRLNELRFVTAHPNAVCDRSGSVTLHVPPGDFPTDSSLRPGFRPGCDAVVVPATTVDTFVEREKLQRLDLIKIDTETTEPEVLSGARGTLARHRPLIICEVLAGQTEERLHAALDGQGYSYYWITRRGLERRLRIEGDPTYHERNYLFVPEERVQRLREISTLRV